MNGFINSVIKIPVAESFSDYNCSYFNLNWSEIRQDLIRCQMNLYKCISCFNSDISYCMEFKENLEFLVYLSMSVQRVMRNAQIQFIPNTTRLETLKKWRGILSGFSDATSFVSDLCRKGVSFADEEYELRLAKMKYDDKVESRKQKNEINKDIDKANKMIQSGIPEGNITLSEPSSILKIAKSIEHQNVMLSKIGEYPQCYSVPQEYYMINDGDFLKESKYYDPVKYYRITNKIQSNNLLINPLSISLDIASYSLKFASDYMSKLAEEEEENIKTKIAEGEEIAKMAFYVNNDILEIMRKYIKIFSYLLQDCQWYNDLDMIYWEDPLSIFSAFVVRYKLIFRESRDRTYSSQLGITIDNEKVMKTLNFTSSNIFFNNIPEKAGIDLSVPLGNSCLESLMTALEYLDDISKNTQIFSDSDDFYIEWDQVKTYHIIIYSIMVTDYRLNPVKKSSKPVYKDGQIGDYCTEIISEMNSCGGKFCMERYSEEYCSGSWEIYRLLSMQ